jgi:hypothetical protein
MLSIRLPMWCARLAFAVVLLARDTPPAAPGIKDLDLDMSQWQPLIEDRAFVSWLVKVRRMEK